jgi:hypothetical protein
MNPFDYAWSYVASIAGDPNTAILNFRAIHDTNKEIPAHDRRGTLLQWWEWLSQMNQQGYGIFAAVNALDGNGRELENVEYCRVQCIDLDNMSAQQNFERAAASNPNPAFAVQSSPGKYHVYWSMQPYIGNDRFQTMQRRLRQHYDADKSIIDATRVMRVPGFWHMKQPAQPHLVTCFALPGLGMAHHIETLEAAYAHVNVIDGGDGVRHELGTPELAAPSVEWLTYALQLVDPNDLDRAEWVAIMSAVKQSGWTFGESVIRPIFDAWCARYAANDLGENDKQWKSIRNTALGWPSLVRRVPSLKAALTFGANGVQQQSAPVATMTPPPVQSVIGANPPPLDCSGEYLTYLECKEWFKGCTFVVAHGKILAPDGRLQTSTQFNGAYGGKKFIIDGENKTTNEAWAAALRSTLWQVPKVDHLRFLPHLDHGAIVLDDLGRKGVNMYKPATVRTVQGDPSPFLRHVAMLLPDQNDQRILLDFLAHNVRFPGHKIPWMPVIQSVEGAGKGVFKKLMTYALGKPYVHFPNAAELTEGGSKFNAWLRNKLFILADEIKVDDKRDLIEKLKPMISETYIEIQGKGVDQDIEDNYANWLSFTNYKGAVPVSRNGRRYAIFYTPLQTKQDLAARGMDKAYYDALYEWLDADGAAIVTQWLRDYPIERGAIPMTAPQTSSWAEALKISRTPAERVIIEAIEDNIPGFAGGWVSAESAVKRIREKGAMRGTLPPHAIAEVLESLGYVPVGRAPRPFHQEGGGDNHRSELFFFGGWSDPVGFGRAQGWE